MAKKSKRLVHLVVILAAIVGAFGGGMWWFLGETSDPRLSAEKVWSASIDFTDDIDQNQPWLDRTEAVFAKTKVLKDAKDFLQKEEIENPWAEHWRCLWLYIENVSQQTVRIKRIERIHYLFYGRTVWREDQSIVPWPEDTPSEVEIEKFSVGIDIPPGERLFFLLGIFWSDDDEDIKADEIAYFKAPVIVARNLHPLPWGSWSFPLEANKAIPPTQYRLSD